MFSNIKQSSVQAGHRFTFDNKRATNPTNGHAEIEKITVSYKVHLLISSKKVCYHKNDSLCTKYL